MGQGGRGRLGRRVPCTPLPGPCGHPWGPASSAAQSGGSSEPLPGWGTARQSPREQRRVGHPQAPGVAPPCQRGLVLGGVLCSLGTGGDSGVACWVFIAGRAGGGRGRGRGEGHPGQARGVGGCVLSCEALTADGAAVVLLQPGHDAAVVEQVVAGQLPHVLAQPIVILAHRALQPGACGSGEPL